MERAYSADLEDGRTVAEGSGRAEDNVGCVKAHYCSWGG
jgi:hypothetical protein